MSRQIAEVQETHARLTELHRQQTNAGARNRLRMLMLLHDNPERALADVARELECSDRSVLRWWGTYKEGGLDALLERRHKGRVSRLAKLDIDEIRTKIAEEGMTGVDEIRTWLADEYGLQYSRSGVWYILRETLRARRNTGWLLLDDEKTPETALDGASQPLDNPMAVIGLLNSLPMTDDVVEWGNGFRTVLHRLLPDVDRISVNVNRSCDMRRPERYDASTRVNRAAGGSGESEEDSIWVDKNRTNEPPYVRVLEGFKAKGLPLHEFHTPLVRDYFFDGKAYLGSVFLWRSVNAAPIPHATEERFRSLEPFILYAISDVVTRHQVLQPMSGVFYEAAHQMFEDAGLSSAERKIVSLALLGHPYKEIAAISTVTLDAVKKHFHAVFKKTNTRSQAELFAKYFTAQFRREQSEIDVQA